MLEFASAAALAVQKVDNAEPIYSHRGAVHAR
jgi:hypothetical protein